MEQEGKSDIIPLYIYGEYSYYIDMDAFNEVIVRMAKKSENPEQQTPIVFDMFRNFVDIVMDSLGNEEEEDPKLGVDRILEKQDPSFKMAFNTLKTYNILKEID